jgi:hypothetical protein
MHDPFYDLPEWRHLRRRYLAAHPACEVAGCNHRARHVDHVVPRRVAPHRAFDISNLQALCHAHHSQVTRAFDGDRLAGACDVDGNPLDPAHPWQQQDNRTAIRVVNDRPAISATIAARLKRETVNGRRR